MILTYHEITASQSPYLYSVSEERLAEHLEWIDWIRAHSGDGREAPIVSFDDGHASFRRYGLGLLDKYRCPAIVFVTVGWTGQRSGYMSWPQLEDVAAAGHEVQAHGWSHKFLTACSPDELQRELVDAKHALEDRLGVAVDAVSAPGGRWNSRVLHACAHAGYHRLYTSDPWPGQRLRGDIRIFGRVVVRHTTTVSQLARQWQPSLLDLLTVRIGHWLKRGTRRLVGDNVYESIWQLFAVAEERQRINRDYDGTAS